MFKNYYGFDSELFQYGTPIRIHDKSLHGSGDVRADTPLHKHSLHSQRERLTGNYLVYSCDLRTLKVVNANGDFYVVPVENCIGDSPDLLIQVLHEEKNMEGEREYSLFEIIADIAINIGAAIERGELEAEDSRELNSQIICWAIEFQSLYDTLASNGTVDYIEMIDEFSFKKIEERKEG